MRCPVCQAESNAGPNCRRCHADLSLLFRLEEDRARLIAQAERALFQGAGANVAALAGAVAELRPGVDEKRLRALGLLLQRDFAGAYLAYRDAIAEGAVP